MYNPGQQSPKLPCTPAPRNDYAMVFVVGIMAGDAFRWKVAAILLIPCSCGAMLCCVTWLRLCPKEHCRSFLERNFTFQRCCGRALMAQL